MKALWIVLPVLVWFYFGYRFYGGLIERRLVKPDYSRVTPAFRFKDGVDFHPSRKRLLGGNHFASIAGAGPLSAPFWPSPCSVGDRPWPG